MFYKWLKYCDDFLDMRSKRELYMIFFSIIGAVFCLIYLLIVPSVGDFLSQKSNAYEQAKFILSQNTHQLAKISSQESKESLSGQTQSLQKNLFVFKQASKTDYDILAIITKLTKKLQLDIISDILLDEKDISLSLSGRFEDVSEFIRLIEQYHFVFIQDLQLKPNNQRIDCILHLANLGASLWNF